MRKLIYANKGLAGELLDELKRNEPIRIMAKQARFVHNHIMSALGIADDYVDSMIRVNEMCDLCGDTGQHPKANGEADFDWSYCDCSKGRELLNKDHNEDLEVDDYIEKN